MKSMIDVRNLLKRFGIFIYTGSRSGDAELMEMEIREMYKLNLIEKEDYIAALLLLAKEKTSAKN